MGKLVFILGGGKKPDTCPDHLRLIAFAGREKITDDELYGPGEKEGINLRRRAETQGKLKNPAGHRPIVIVLDASGKVLKARAKPSLKWLKGALRSLRTTTENAGTTPKTRWNPGLDDEDGGRIAD